MNSLWKQWSIVITDVLLCVDTAVWCNYRWWVVESNPWQQSGLFAFSRILMVIFSHWFSLCLAGSKLLSISELKLPSLTQNRKWG